MTDADAGLLREAGIPVPAVGRHALNAGKTLLRLPGGAGMVKLARHPAGRSLLRAEAAAYGAPPPAPPYVRPDMLAFHDGSEATLLWLAQLPGAALSRWRSLRSLPGPFESMAAGERPLPELLPAPDTPWSATWGPRIAARWPGATVAAGPSHGDFVYWNLLKLPDGRLGLLDYEHYAPVAPAAADRLFWRLSPLCRVAARNGWGGPPYQLVRRMAPAAEIALVLLRHGDRLSREGSLPDAAALYDRATIELGRRLMALYATLLGRLLA